MSVKFKKFVTGTLILTMIVDLVVLPVDVMGSVLVEDQAESVTLLEEEILTEESTEKDEELLTNQQSEESLLEEPVLEEDSEAELTSSEVNELPLESGVLPEGKYVISEDNLTLETGRIIRIEEGTTVTITSNVNIPAKGLYSQAPTLDLNGGAILNEGTLILNQIYVKNGRGYLPEDVEGIIDTAGGAVYNSEGATLKVGCIFKDNSASFGGAIYNEGTVQINEKITQFIDNSACEGGAVYNTFTGQVVISGEGEGGINSSSLFYRNTAEQAGGAIYNEGDISFKCSTELHQCKVSDGDGGAIYNAGTIESANSEIETRLYLCSATRGGGIYNAQKGTVDLAGNLNAELLEVTDRGGGIYNSGAITLENIEMHNCLAMESNGCGGGIYNDAWGSIVINCSEASFRENDAELAGGALYNVGSFHLGVSATKTFVSACFESNFSLYGAAIYNTDELDGYDYNVGQLVIEDAVIRNNSATKLGGAVYNSASFMFSGEMKNNSAGTAGGVIVNRGDGTVVLGHNKAYNQKTVIESGTGVNCVKSIDATESSNILIYSGTYDFSPSSDLLAPGAGVTALENGKYLVEYNAVSILNAPDYKSTNWMSYISDNTRLTQMTIPGTHDSGTFNVALRDQDNFVYKVKNLFKDAMKNDKNIGLKFVETFFATLEAGVLTGIGDEADTFAQTQDMTIKGQLEMGIRAFDLRVQYDTEESKYPFIAHGHNTDKPSAFLRDLLSYYCLKAGAQKYDTDNDLLLLDDVLTEFEVFLDKNPTETVIVNVQEAAGKIGKPLDAHNQAVLDAHNDSLVYLYSDEEANNTTLGSVRGKIVVNKLPPIRGAYNNFHTTREQKLADMQQVFGDAALQETSKSLMTVFTTNDCKIYKFNDVDPAMCYLKVKFLPMVHFDSRLWISVREETEYMQRSFLDLHPFEKYGKNKAYGIVMLDFPKQQFINECIDVNSTLEKTDLYSVHTISYDYCGGINGPVSQQVRDCDSAVISTVVPEIVAENTECSFKYWSTSRDGNGSFRYEPGDTINSLNRDLELYAIYSAPANFTISYQLNGGTNGEDAPTEYTYYPAIDRDDMSSEFMLPTPTRAGYSFDGWYEEATFRHEVCEVPIDTVGNKTYYAKWLPKRYKITYNLGGVDAELEAGAKLVYTVEDTINPLPKVTNIPKDSQGNALYEFLGWTYYACNEGQTVSEIPVQEADDLVLSAVWKKNSHKIKFEMGIEGDDAGALNNGGNTLFGSEFGEFVPGESIKLKAPEWFGDGPDEGSFVKWSTIPYEENGGSAVYPFTAKESSELVKDGILRTTTDHTTDITLYAYWTNDMPGVKGAKTACTGNKRMYDITYSLEDGVLNNNDPLVKYVGEEIRLTTPTRVGYDFRGWVIITNDNNAACCVGNKIPANLKSDLTVEGLWEPKEYTITYYTDGGTNSGSNVSGYCIDESVILQPAKKFGYDFRGWYLDRELTEQITTIPKGSTKNYILYAGWDIKEYGITYHSNLPEGLTTQEQATLVMPENPGTYRIDTETFGLNQPSLAGYEFQGWYADLACMNYPISQVEKGSIGDLALYAKWQKTDSELGKKYKITYVTLEGTHNDANPTGYNSGDNLALYPAFWNPEVTPEMYFKGWYLDPYYYQQINHISSNLSGDLTLYARWGNKSEINVTFECGERAGQGTIESNAGVTLGEILAANETLGTPLPGRTFEGWYTDRSYSSVSKVANDYVFNYDTVLYGKITAIDYKLTYHLFDGEYVSYEGSYENNNPLTYTVNDKVVLTAPTLESEGFFKGWYTDSARTQHISVIPEGSLGNMDLYAKWDNANKLKVTFDINQEGLSNPDSISLNYGETIGKCNGPANVAEVDGYKLNGWFENQEGTGRKWNINRDAVTCDLCLYANWVPKTYSITYELSDADNHTDNPESYNILSETINLKAPSKKGFVFDGWFSDAELTQPVINIPTGSTGDLTLYASFSPDYVVECENGASYAYSGAAVKPTVTVRYGNKVLSAGKDYKVSYANNAEAYSLTQADEGFDSTKAPRVTVSGKRAKFTTKVFYFTINPLNLSAGSVSVSDIPFAIAGRRAYSPKITVLTNHKKLKINKDYCVTYYETDESGNKIDTAVTPKNPGNYIAEVVGVDNCKGTVTKTFTIYDSTHKTMTKLRSSGITNRIYTGLVEKPSEEDIVITDGRTKLTNGTDYTLSFSPENPIACGVVTVTVTGKNTYVGSKTFTYKIVGTAMKKVAVNDFEKKVTYDGNPKKQNNMYLTYGKASNQIILDGVSKETYLAMPESQKLEQSYYYEYVNNVNAGKASVIITGVSGYTGSIKKTFTIAPYDLNLDTRHFSEIELAPDTYSYTGKAIKPAPSVVFRGQTLALGRDYTVSYKNNVKVYPYLQGQAGYSVRKAPYLVIKGKGNYCGSKTLYFKIEEE